MTNRRKRWRVPCAVIFNGGQGKRLIEVTKKFMPKGYIFFNSRPLISYQLSALRKAGIREVIVMVNNQENLDFLDRLRSEKFFPPGMKISGQIVCVGRMKNPLFNFSSEKFYRFLGKRGALFLSSDHIFLSSDLEAALGRICEDERKSLICFPEQVASMLPFTMKNEEFVQIKRPLENYSGKLKGIYYLSGEGLAKTKEVSREKTNLLSLEALTAKLIETGERIKAHPLKFVINMNLPQDYRKVKEIFDKNMNFMLE